jgi:6-phosphogluconolactonase
MPFMKNIFLGVIALLVFTNAHAQTSNTKPVIANLLVGTYTKKGSKGIYVFNFDTATGKATQLSATDSCDNPSFLTISKDKQFVYAVNETSNGMLSAFAFNNNKLKLLQQKPTKGADPCYIALSPDEHTIFVANYSGGSITQFHRFADGRISNPQQHVQHNGSSINASRQEKAHVHGTFFSPNGKYLLTPDLGMDQVAIYPYSNSTSLPLDIQKTSFIQSTPGAGPRHLAFSKNGKFIYIIEELTGSISVYSFTNGKASFVQTVFTHPTNFNGAPGSADIHISPDGLFLYASNRGEENNIAKFPILSNGKLDDKKRTLTPSGGKMPRNFTISQDGNWVLVAHQGTDNIVVFKRDKITGEITNTGNSIKISMPVCLVMF